MGHIIVYKNANLWWIDIKTAVIIQQYREQLAHLNDALKKHRFISEPENPPVILMLQIWHSKWSYRWDAIFTRPVSFITFFTHCFTLCLIHSSNKFKISKDFWKNSLNQNQNHSFIMADTIYLKIGKRENPRKIFGWMINDAIN